MRRYPWSTRCWVAALVALWLLIAWAGVDLLRWALDAVPPLWYRP